MKPEEIVAETSKQCAAILDKPLVNAITLAISGAKNITLNQMVKHLVKVADALVKELKGE